VNSRRLWLFGLAGGLLALVALATASAEAWRPLPWHLLDHTWSYPPVPEFQQLSAQVEIAGRVGSGDHVYIAPLYGKVGGTAFYFGMQTDLGGKGPGFIFSRWGAATREDGRPAPGGWVDALTDAQSGEGDFVGVRLSYPWTPGRYTFRLRAVPEGRVQRLELEVFDHQRARLVDLGSLRTPSAAAAFFSEPVAFVEIYGKRPPAGPVTPFTVSFKPPLVNGSIQPSDGRSRTPAGVPPLARVQRAADAIVIQVGGFVSAE
jgi:hypothetical protein